MHTIPSNITQLIAQLEVHPRIHNQVQFEFLPMILPRLYDALVGAAERFIDVEEAMDSLEMGGCRDASVDREFLDEQQILEEEDIGGAFSGLEDLMNLLQSIEEVDEEMEADWEDIVRLMEDVDETVERIWHKQQALALKSDDDEDESDSEDGGEDESGNEHDDEGEEYDDDEQD